MCGRVSLAKTNPDEIADQLGAELADGVRERYKARWNIGPMQWALIVRPENNGKRLVMPARWGIERVIGRNEDGSRKTATPFNTMVEKIAKPTWNKAFQERRCVLPVTGFYEWTGPKKDRRPIHFTRQDGGLLYLAGVFDYEKDDEPARFSVLTTTANKTLAPYHDRMPVIIEPVQLANWLVSPDNELLRPANDDLLIGAAASKLVNTVGNEGPQLLVPEPPSELALE